MKNKKLYRVIFILSFIFTLTGCTDDNRQSNDAGDKNSNISNDQILEEDAKTIALERVPGATKEDIREFRIDRGLGLLEYEGKIFYNGREYEFEIDGSDGTILEWEIEDI